MLQWFKVNLNAEYTCMGKEIILKTTIRKSTYIAIYRLLNRVSPIASDCGQLCNAACCSCEDTSSTPDGTDYDMGIYLLPGEEKVFNMKEDWLKWSIEEAEDYDFPESWFGKIYFIRCKTPPHCHREMRPLQCRFYPLSPYLTEEGRLQLIYSIAQLPYECPLVKYKERYKLEEDFIKATYTVWKRLIKDPLIYDLVDMDSEDIRFMENKIYPVTP